MHKLVPSLLLTSSLLLNGLPHYVAAQAPTKQWDYRFGGTAGESTHALQQTSDGGYILGGTSASPLSGDKTQANQGQSDYWVVKLDASGTKQWDRAFGGADNDQLYALPASICLVMPPVAASPSS